MGNFTSSEWLSFYANDMSYKICGLKNTAEFDLKNNTV